MSVELLRRAAALMRERAMAATPGPWSFTDSEAVNDVWEGGMVVVNLERDPIANVCDEWYENDHGEPAPVDDARHIAAWHPAVALAAASLLDHMAYLGEIDGSMIEETGRGRALIALARAYLGEPDA